MTTTTTTNPTPDVALPPGTETYTGWESDSNGTSRIIWGDARTVEATGISLQAHAVQLADGSIDVNKQSGDRPGIAIDEIDGNNSGLRERDPGWRPSPGRRTHRAN